VEFLGEKVIVKFPQSDGHTEKLAIKKEGLGGVQWEKRENEEVLTRDLSKEESV
jgi:hypothetical protein